MWPRRVPARAGSRRRTAWYSGAASALAHGAERCPLESVSSVAATVASATPRAPRRAWAPNCRRPAVEVSRHVGPDHSVLGGLQELQSVSGLLLTRLELVSAHRHRTDQGSWRIRAGHVHADFVVHFEYSDRPPAVAPFLIRVMCPETNGHLPAIGLPVDPTCSAPRWQVLALIRRTAPTRLRTR